MARRNNMTWNRKIVIGTIMNKTIIVSIYKERGIMSRYLRAMNHRLEHGRAKVIRSNREPAMSKAEVTWDKIREYIVW